MNRARWTRLGLGIALAGLFGWLLVRQTDLSSVVRALSRSDPAWVGVAVAAFGLGYALRIARWRLMLSTRNPQITWLACAGPLMAGFAANNLLPFRAGDLLRAAAFTRTLGVDTGTVLASLLVERLLDLLMVLMFALSASLFVSSRISDRIGISSLAVVLTGTVIVLLLCWSAAGRTAALWCGKALGRRLPAAAQRINTEVDHLLSGLRLMAHAGLLVRLLFFSAAAWLAEGLVFWSAAQAISGISEPAGAWVALPVATFATLIPSTPGYLGTFDYFAARTMVEFGNAEPAAAAFAVLVHVLLWLPPTLIGGFYWIRHPLRNPDPSSQTASAS